MIVDLSRLKSQLLVSGLQQKDNPLFQVINQLIDSVARIQGSLDSNISNLSSIITGEEKINFPNYAFLGNENEEFESIPIPIPGKDGIIGRDGLQGIPGLDGLDSEIGEQGIPGLTGPQGIAGVIGATGPIGPIGLQGAPGMDGLSSEEIEPFYLQSGSGISPHPLLDGSFNNDTIANAPTRGSLIYGNATPKWDELPIGAADTFLKSDGTDVSWQSVPSSSDVDRVVETGTTKTIIDTNSIAAMDYFAIQGTGTLQIQGDAALGVL